MKNYLKVDFVMYNDFDVINYEYSKDDYENIYKKLTLILKPTKKSVSTEDNITDILTNDLSKIDNSGSFYISYIDNYETYNYLTLNLNPDNVYSDTLLRNGKLLELLKTVPYIHFDNESVRGESAALKLNLL